MTLLISLRSRPGGFSQKTCRSDLSPAIVASAATSLVKHTKRTSSSRAKSSFMLVKNKTPSSNCPTVLNFTSQTATVLKSGCSSIYFRRRCPITPYPAIPTRSFLGVDDWIFFIRSFCRSQEAYERPVLRYFWHA